MSILSQFYIVKKGEKEERFLFWSCVLDVCLDISGFDLNYLNSDFNIDGFGNFILKIEYKKFTSEIISSDYENYNQKRPETFLITDATMECGSPYRHAGALIKTYYQIPSDFISALSQFINLPSDYQFTQFQLQIISIIKKELGIDIIKNESIPGSLSVYTRLPGFIVNGNYNARNGGTRYITIHPEDMTKYENAFVELEITDDNKILFRKLCKYVSAFYYEFPSTGELEQFSQFRISIYDFEKPKEQYNKIYEEHFYLIRSFSLSGSIGGGRSKLVKNRFLGNTLDTIPIMHHQPYSSTLNKRDWIDWEREYKDVLFGKNKEYLQSMFFPKNEAGRKRFLDWARKIISRGQRVTLVDPFFDANGLTDFIACIDSNLKIRILMKNPEKYPKEFGINAQEHLKNIFESFPGAKIFFIENIHDRYLVVEEEEKNAVYSLSNSWNGTVNNYSLYVQEIPLLPALEIGEEIEDYIENTPPEVNTFTEAGTTGEASIDKSVYTEAYINEHISQLEAVTAATDRNCFILICRELFWSHYYTDIDKQKIVAMINEKINLYEKDDRITIITMIVVELLTKQKKLFVREKRYLGNKPFSYYNTPEKCIERLRIRNFWGTRYHDLALDYALYELLESIFYIDPEAVIAELTANEEEICVICVGETREPLRYYTSELIISSFLASKYPAVPIKEDALELINKVKSNSYCRIFFALAFVYNDRKEPLPFMELEKLFALLNLTPDELLLLLADMYVNILIQKKNPYNRKNNSDILKDAISFVLQNYSNKDIVKFAYKAYISSYEIQLDELKCFIGQLENSERVEEKENIEKLLLLSAFQTNEKLQNRMKEIMLPPDYILREIIAPPYNRKPEDTDSVKYHNLIPYLGYLFACFLEKSPQKNKIKNIRHTLAVDKALLFQMYKFPANMGLFYYEAAFLLSTALSLEESTVNIKESLLEWLGWYLPCCLNAYSDDFYGLSIQVIDLYTTLQTDEKNRSFLSHVRSNRDKILVASNTKKQTQEDIALYKKVLKKYIVESQEKDIILLLNIVINLCFRCTDNNEGIKEEILQIVKQLQNDTRGSIAEQANKLIDAGIAYALESSKITEGIFKENMNALYHPYSARRFIEDSNV